VRSGSRVLLRALAVTACSTSSGCTLCQHPKAVRTAAGDTVHVHFCPRRLKLLG
jgi:hypothetical protein